MYWVFSLEENIATFLKSSYYVYTKTKTSLPRSGNKYVQLFQQQTENNKLVDLRNTTYDSHHEYIYTIAITGHKWTPLLISEHILNYVLIDIFVHFNFH